MLFSLCLALVVVAACRSGDQRRYTLQGQVVSVAPNHQEATIKHEEIKGFMPAMTMPYKVKEPELLDLIAPGDLINATLVVLTNDAYLADLKQVGRAPLEHPPAEVAAASSGFRTAEARRSGARRSVPRSGRQEADLQLFQRVEPRCHVHLHTLPDANLLSADGPEFRNDSEAAEADSAPKRRVHLISVSFDPATDTPQVLKQHARMLQADPNMWTFLTGARDDIDRFAARFGVSVARALDGQENITHTLRTAIVDADGRLVKGYVGNEWTPLRSSRT